VRQRLNLRHQYSRAAELASAQVVQRLVGIGEQIGRGVGLHASLASDRKELLAVASCEVRDGDELALLPQQAIGHCRNVAHVDAATHDTTAPPNGAKCRRHQLSDGREYYRRIQRFGRNLVGTAGPGDTERDRELLRGAIVAPCERKHLPALPDCDLGNDMSGGTETV